MRLINLELLKPGDILARPLLDSRGKPILNSGVAITEKMIDKLSELNITRFYIFDERFSDVEEMESIDINTKISILNCLKTANQNVQAGKSVDEYGLKDSAKKIVDIVREFRDKGASISPSNIKGDYILEHSLNVAILTAYLSKKMPYNYSQICDLVTGALIHDIGRTNKPQEEPEHTQIGFDIIRQCRGISLHSSIVCYQHHENYDGTGYPRGIKADKISEYSRIIRVADCYMDAIEGSEDGKPKMPLEAYESILAISGSVLDPGVVEKFRDAIVFYPNGCTVKLNDGQNGVVVKQNQGSPQRLKIARLNAV